jgi:hypothetical protein
MAVRLSLSRLRERAGVRGDADALAISLSSLLA